MASRALVAYMTLCFSFDPVHVASLDETSTGAAASLEVFERQDCPPCSGLFSRLSIDADGKRVQHVEVQLQGEPKMSAERKHKLPVGEYCRWQHPPGLTLDTFGCTTVQGRPVENYFDIWACMEEASCEIDAGEKMQFAPLRDPRAAAVSTYFHAVRGGTRYSYMPDNVDEGALHALPSVTQWIALRHILFEGVLANSSKTFWYEDATEDPLDWHFRWTELAGLRLPIPWIENITSLRLDGPWVDMTRGINPHPGGQAKSEARTWRDEVSPEIIDEMNSIVRTWLPGVLLARLGIHP